MQIKDNPFNTSNINGKKSKMHSIVICKPLFDKALITNIHTGSVYEIRRPRRTLTTYFPIVRRN